MVEPTMADPPAANRSNWSLLKTLTKVGTKAVNVVESATGIDIDGDGDVNDNEPRRPTMWRWQKSSRRVLLKPPTAQQIDVIGSKMEALVAEKCSHVRLEMARRRLTVLKEIKFHGSKHAAGVDAFVEPHLAEQICSEVAIALQLCNDLLLEQGTAPLGLAVEGHTSASIHGHDESVDISTKRSKQCKRSIVRHMLAANRGSSAMWDVQVDDLIQPRGYGSTQPLPDYADGGNYVQNRRVEMRLLETGQEGYCAPFSVVAALPIDPAVEAATKIQARMRGQQARKKIQHGKSRSKPEPGRLGRQGPRKKVQGR